MGDTLPVRTVRMVLGGVCQAGRVGGQATHSGSTRTPSPAVVLVAAVGGTCYGLTPHIYLGGGAGNADHSMLGETVELREIPEGPPYRSGVATSHEHQAVAWRLQSAGYWGSRCQTV